MTEQKEFKVTMSEEDILANVKEYTNTAKQYYTAELKSKFKNYIDAYNGNIEEAEKEYHMPKSSFVSRDIAILIKTVLPDIQKLVFTDEPVTLTPQGQEDVEKAQRVQALLNYQITKQNKYSKTMEKIAIDALITGTAYLKCQWVKEFDTEEVIQELSAEQIAELEMAGYEVKSEYAYSNEQGEVYKATYKQNVLKKDQPVYERVPYYELFIDPSADEIENANYVIHRRLVTLDYLRREEAKGNYNNIDDLIDNAERKGVYYVDNYDEDDNEHYIKLDANKNNKPLNNVMIYEFWGKLDINEDGYLEDVIVTYTGNYILSVEENLYKAYPFFVFVPDYNTNKIYGQGLAELAYSGQMIKTTLIREYLLNTRRNNDPRFFYNIDAVAFPEQLEEDDKYIAIRKEYTNLSQIFVQEPFEAIAPSLQNTVAYIDRDLQQVTGISEAKQGVKSSSNQTATEATIKYEAANSRIQSIALHFAETLKELYKFLLYQNQVFLNKDIQIRLFNNIIDFKADEIQNIDYDIQVSATLGSGTQQARLANYQSVLQLQTGVGLQLGICDIIQIRNTLSKIIEETGLKDTDNYIMSEQEITQKQEQMLAQTQMAQGGMSIPQTPTQQQAQQTPLDTQQALNNMLVK